ncbi:hypothetical protein JCM10908_005342 [Rhodotorula pacifica]|uniref:uncharacterized protein n=1 Tax=Rhodotorula pacifica TaxID=1495444 RepID=UPI003172F5F5
MAPAASKKAYGSGVATQADDAKYRQKYGELKRKLAEVEEDNTKLSVKILRSKKAIQRLRIERAILYDRLQSTVAPTNPYALSSAAHLSTLAASSSSSSASTSAALPPNILQPPSYPLADPQAPTLFLQQLDAQKLAALQHGPGAEVDFAAKPVEGIVGEAQQAREHERLMAAGGAIEAPAAAADSQAAAAAAAEGGSASTTTTSAAQDVTAAAGGQEQTAPASAAAVPQAVEVSPAAAQQTAMDQQP